MIDRGSIAEKALIKSGLTKGYVAKELGISRKTLYNKLERPDLDYAFIIDFYEVLKLDVTEDFPELGKIVVKEAALEQGEKSESQTTKSALVDCTAEVEKWKNKYIQLMEEYNQVLKENRDLQGKKTG